MPSSTSASLYHELTLSRLHLGQIAVILLVSLPLAVLVGFYIGRTRRRRLREEGDAIEKVVSETTMNAFLALLGLLLAFTFGNSLSVFESIKGAITNEAAALGTAFLRVDYLAEPGRTELQTAILDYAKTRIVPKGARIDTPDKAQAFLEKTLTAQSRLWPLTLEATRDPTPPPIQVFVAGAINAVLDAHLYRLATLSVPISAFTQAMVLAGAVIAVLLVGNRLGMLGHALTWRAFVFAFFLAAIMYTIADIRRSSEGLIRVDDSALYATIFDMEQALAGRNQNPDPAR
jgi:ABC-type multidrug transport system fused ATPase/permease subunit